MKYLKLFNTNTEYETFIESEDFIHPNVSYIEETNEVKYNLIISQPNDEIWYTSSDGDIVTPFQIQTDVFGANIISNTYENGKGIIKFDDDVTSIGGNAFFLCDSLTSITIPDSVTSIGESAFSDCRSLTSITIPNSVTSMGSDAFKECHSLTSVVIGNSVESIGDWTFRNCFSLTSIVIGNSVTSIGESAFSDCRSLTSITIPNSVEIIGDYAFDNCSSLTSITIPDSVTSIGWSIFSGCYFTTDNIHCPEASDPEGNNYWEAIIIDEETEEGICIKDNEIVNVKDKTRTTYNIPNSVEIIGDTAFMDCLSLTSITIPDSVTSIGDSAFGFCSSLTSITIPDSVTSIRGGAFMECTSLASITIPDSVTSIEWSIFSGCYFTRDNFHCPERLDPEGNNYWEAIIIDEETEEGICIKDNVAVRARGNITTANNIPDSVTSIRDNAFQGCTSLTSVTIPDSVTSIGVLAFGFCSSLTTLTSLNTTPPTASYSILDETPKLTSIFVPAESVDLYKSATNWSDYADKIKAIED